MRLTKPTLPLVATFGLPLALAGCNGAFLGNFFVLGVTIAIFLGTLSLGRKGEPTRADRSTADGSRSTSPLTASDVRGSGPAGPAAPAAPAVPVTVAVTEA